VTNTKHTCIFQVDLLLPTNGLCYCTNAQVVVGRFQVDENKKLNQAATGGVPGASSSTPRGALNGSSGSAQN
jgi:hypothetical protein